MKKKKKLFGEFVTGRGFYLTAAICLCLIAAAVGVIYRSATNLVKDYVETEITSLSAELTENAEAQKDDEPDPRETATEASQEDTTAKATETTAQTTEQPTDQTQVAESEQVISYSEQSFIYPVTEDILKDYSDTPAYDETMDDWRVHKGVDFACEQGTPVYAVGDGKVTKVYSDTSYGYCIEIDHGSLTARYCGLEQGTTLSIDDEVRQGDIVGLTGSIPCEENQQEHFHFEVLVDGERVDPIQQLK